MNNQINVLICEILKLKVQLLIAFTAIGGAYCCSYRFELRSRYFVAYFKAWCRSLWQVKRRKWHFLLGGNYSINL